MKSIIHNPITATIQRRLLGFITVCILLILTQQTVAATPVVKLVIKDHLFFPSDFEIPANTKVKLLVHNQDPTAEEFESYELNREKVIGGGRKAVIFIGPLPPGDYPFFGEFYPKTAQGIIRVK